MSPGPVRTERWAGLVDAMARDMKTSPEEADTLAPRSIPLGRIAECEKGLCQDNRMAGARGRG